MTDVTIGNQQQQLCTGGCQAAPAGRSPDASRVFVSASHWWIALGDNRDGHTVMDSHGYRSPKFAFSLIQNVPSYLILDILVIVDIDLYE